MKDYIYNSKSENDTKKIAFKMASMLKKGDVLVLCGDLGSGKTKFTEGFLTYFGLENDISVACCGSSLSSYQVQLLLEYGVKEIIIGFDKQFKELNTDESRQWREKLTKIYMKYKNDVNISFLWDKDNVLGYKSSPIDEGPDKFLYLFKNRIIL